MTAALPVNRLAMVAALIGDPTRAAMLSALMDGRALPAGELAWHAGITPQTASGHLAQMLEAGLLALERQGRHRYFRLASVEVASALETLMVLAVSEPPRRHPATARDTALCTARTCYDHLAGRLGTALADALAVRGDIRLEDGTAAITEAGRDSFAALDLGLPADATVGRPLCRTCLDWSERRPHLAGRLGTALCAAAFARGWIVRLPDTRAVGVTAEGCEALRRHFGLVWP